MTLGKISLPLFLWGCVAASFGAMEFKAADITTVKNIVERNEGSGAVPAKVNDKIGENSMVSTAAASMAELTFADTSITRMGSNTQFSFKSKERLVKLEQGTILIHTPPGNGGATVDCGGVTGAVSGTTFMASRDGVGNVLFVLLEGQGGLKVTAGGSTTVIRPGQAASVGAESVKEAAGALSSEKSSAGPTAGSSSPGGDEKGPGTGASAGPATGGGDAGGGALPTPKIQVFDVDVKRVVATSPLVVEFKAELPSASKIEKVVETQQQAVKEGKLEKLEVEAVAVKTGDGDLLVGAPKVEKEEFVIVNKKMDVVGKAQGGGDGMDIDTAAGPGAGGGTPVAAAPVPRAEAPAPPPPPAVNPVVSVVSQVATQTPAPILAPSSLNLSFANGTGTITLDRAALQATAVTLSGLSGLPATVIIPAGSTSVSFAAAPRNFFPGLQNPTDPASAYLASTVTASAGTLTDSANAYPAWFDLNAIRAANPARRLLSQPGSVELAALDNFFYFTGQAGASLAGAPSTFFSTIHQARNLSWGQVESLGRLSQLYAAQTSDYFFMGNLSAGTAAVPDVNLQNRDRVIFADTIRIDPTVASATIISDFPGAKIPDGNLVGLARNLDLSTQGLSGSFSWFVDQVSLRIDGDPLAFGAFNGDFVSYLRHTKSSGDTATVTLLDRIGSTPLAPEGSSDNGLSVTFSDFGNSAIHQAQSVVSGGATTGTYQPDRGTTLLTAGFGPVDPLGQFTLATFDASSGAEGYLTSWSVQLVQRLAISLDNGVGKSFSLVAGNGGLFLKNTLWDLGGTQAEFATTGNLFLGSDSFFFPGNSLRMEAAGSAELVDVKVLGNAAAGSEVVVRARQDVTLTDTAIKEVGGQIEVASLNGSVQLLAPDQLLGGTSPSTETKHVELQAEKAVKITGATVVDLDTSAGAKPSTTPVSTVPNSGSQNLAVVRSGDALELRNVVIRGFHGTRLENGAGRVLMSGSSVRDFKIKELTGMAVNADAKIQMAAYDSAGRLEGEMVVENQLPVATKLASQIDNTITGTLGNTLVHAKDVELAARTVRFNDATIAAMNSITARANTILIQNSFMTVVQNTGMINMYVSSGLVNQNFGSVVDGRLNFAGLNTFTIGNNSFAIGNQTQLNAAYGTNLIEIPNGGTPQAGKVNVLKL